MSNSSGSSNTYTRLSNNNNNNEIMKEDDDERDNIIITSPIDDDDDDEIGGSPDTIINQNLIQSSSSPINDNNNILSESNNSVVIDSNNDNNDNDNNNNDISRAKQVKRHIIGTICVLIVVFLWVSSSIVIQIIFTDGGFEKPFFLTYYSTSIFSFYLFGYLFQWKKWSNIPFEDNGRHSGKSLHSITHNLLHCNNNNNNTKRRTSLPTSSSSDDTTTTIRNKKRDLVLNINQMDEEEEPGGAMMVEEIIQEEDQIGLSSNIKKNRYKHSMKSICKISLILCPIWFVANYTFNLSLGMTSVSTNTILSTLSGVFSLFLSVLLKVDKFSFEKLAATLISLVGIVMVSYSDIADSSQGDTFIGDLLAITGAAFYGLYCTLMKKMIKDEEELPIPLMFGLLGFFNIILMWPFFLVLNYAQWEVFEWPSGKVFLYLFANGLFGTFISDLIESYSVVLTSPVINTIGLSLTIPLAMLSDFVRGKEFFGWLYVGGSICVIFGFLLANLASKLFEDRLKRIELSIINLFKRPKLQQ
ncbi:hypothetical protein DFA_11049 [Cavenderia fasciculata]|uniref:EamA domain-containing protein n=1 Tax=Cavenderia fasciculata TaxID=261658 RepID=F4QEH5_CACFS|nr:uncharacterized protein DFA_11049 [Cavenderia fasciculata]EGG13288.1 hypothetical protein DFA_11049 [Cavenderia fasciculata]|eukprot:XP_004349987.1 hypothetical protein DFA_11049 [Cavenderia fasciculata]